MIIKQIDNEYIANTYSRFPVTLISGKGSLLYDENGKEYIDLGSGIAVNTFGVADDQWQKAIIRQLSLLPHTSNLYYTEPAAKLAQLLCQKTAMKKVFFSNSGAEANECAIKAARRYAFQKYGEGHHTIITLKNSFHGRTITTLAATGQDAFHTDFGPFTEGFLYAEPNNLDNVKKLAESTPCAAIIMEVIQGEGGVLSLDKDFIKGVAKLAQEKDMLLIFDEVQTGNGRTGKLYGYMNYNITPDIITTAKGLCGGLPLGATMFGEKVKDVFVPGTHGSTFGGNPVCCAGALSIIERIDDKLLNEVIEKNKYIVEQLSSSKSVKSISGMGLMLGIETVRPVKDIISECIEKGVLILSAKTKVRLLPALNIPFDKLQKAINILKEVMEK